MWSGNVLDEFDSSKHSGVIGYFNQYFVKDGHIPKEASKIICNASEMREQADYEDFSQRPDKMSKNKLKVQNGFMRS